MRIAFENRMRWQPRNSNSIEWKLNHSNHRKSFNLFSISSLLKRSLFDWLSCARPSNAACHNWNQGGNFALRRGFPSLFCQRSLLIRLFYAWELVDSWGFVCFAWEIAGWSLDEDILVEMEFKTTFDFVISKASRIEIRPRGRVFPIISQLFAKHIIQWWIIGDVKFTQQKKKLQSKIQIS